MRIFLKILMARLKSCGILNLYIMKAMKKTIAKAKNGRIVRSKVKDPDDNTIKTKTNTRTGATKTVVKYSDSDSSGKKREVTRTPGLTRAQIKANEFYTNNPKAAQEDDFKPYVPGMKTGGMVNSNKKVNALKSAGSKGVKSGTNKKVSVTPKAKYGMTMKTKKK